LFSRTPVRCMNSTSPVANPLSPFPLFYISLLPLPLFFFFVRETLCFFLLFRLALALETSFFPLPRAGSPHPPQFSDFPAIKKPLFLWTFPCCPPRPAMCFLIGGPLLVLSFSFIFHSLVLCRYQKTKSLCGALHYNPVG